MKKVLIFEPYSNQALAIAKYLKEYGNYYIVGVIEQKRFFNKKNYDEIIMNDFCNIKLDEYNYIFPMGAKSTYQVLNKYKKLIYENGIEFSSHNLIVYDKLKMLSIAKSLSIPIPKTFYKKEEITDFPIFYKENFENGGGVRGVATKFSEIPTHKKLIYQEYIDTPATYGVGFLAKSGKIITYTQHKEIISYPKEGGSAIIIESFNDDRLLQYTKRLLTEINYDGWGLAEFKFCNKRKDYVFMEINAKFWASIEFMLRNNSKFLFYLLNMNYKAIKTNRIVFLDRFIQSNFLDIIKNLKYFKNSTIIIENNYIFLIKVLIKKLIPIRIKKMLKRYLSD